MKKGEIYEGYVKEIKFPNKGLVCVEGEDNYAEVKNVLPGQKISFRVTKKRKGKAEGNLIEVLQKADNQIDPACPHFGSCGGCLYQNLSYEDQLALKASQVQTMLDKVYINRGEEIGYTFEGIKSSPKSTEYRNKMEFSFGDEYKDGPLSLGLHKRGSFYDIVPVTECMIVDADYRLILQTTLAYFREKNTPFYHRMKQEGFLRHLLVRKAVKTEEILVALVTSSQDCQDDTLVQGYVDSLLALQNEGKLSGSYAGVIHIVNDSVADVVKADQMQILYGTDHFTEELLGLSFQISTFSFFQTNSLGAEVLYDTAREYILGASRGQDAGVDGDAAAQALDAVEQNGDSCSHVADMHDMTLYDLYSGTGTIAQMMAPVCKKVIGVEIVEEAVEAAKENAKLNGLHNCDFIAGDVLKVIDDIEEKPDFIILDPPRDGIHPKALPKIIDYGVDRLIYISCKPTSLARDLDVFLDNGYKMEKAICVDMFPNTANVETVCLLSKLHEAKHHVSVKMDSL